MWDMKGKNCLVTGASGGIGKEISLGLLKAGATVIMVVRDQVRGKNALEEITLLSGNYSADLMIADLSSRGQTVKLATDYQNKYNRLDILVNNAGVIQDRKVMTEDGIEMTFAVNYLAYFILTNLLVDLLIKSAPSRVINLTSAAHKAVKLDFENLQGEKSYNRDVSYNQSKLAEIIFSYEIGRRLKGSGVSVNCICPGAVYSNIWQKSSRTINGLFRLFMKSPLEGARLPVYLACSPEVAGITCKYFETRQHLKFQRVNTKRIISKSSKATYDTVCARKLWEISEKLTGIQGFTAV
jgi:retinol dehydrogenase 14